MDSVSPRYVSLAAILLFPCNPKEIAVVDSQKRTETVNTVQQTALLMMIERKKFQGNFMALMMTHIQQISYSAVAKVSIHCAKYSTCTDEA